MGRPHRGPLAALAHPGADRALFDHGPCPVAGVPPTVGASGVDDAATGSEPAAPPRG